MSFSYEIVLTFCYPYPLFVITKVQGESPSPNWGKGWEGGKLNKLIQKFLN